MRLGDGASAIAADLPRASTTVVDVPAGAGDRLETAVARYTSVLAVAGTRRGGDRRRHRTGARRRR
ncbi:hypothetical protein Q9Q99_04520 [Curtobacterium flaccumfaciens]|nr:hypothetical protein Q9Q99_04520 [Curtobacterium flaccumfaciens]